MLVADYYDFVKIIKLLIGVVNSAVKQSGLWWFVQEALAASHPQKVSGWAFGLCHLLIISCYLVILLLWLNWICWFVLLFYLLMYIVRPHIWEFRQPAIKTPYIRYLRCLLGRFLQRSLAWDLFRHLWLTHRRPYTTRFRHHLGLHPLEISLLNFIFHFIIQSIIYYF